MKEIGLLASNVNETSGLVQIALIIGGAEGSGNHADGYSETEQFVEYGVGGECEICEKLHSRALNLVCTSYF